MNKVSAALCLALIGLAAGRAIAAEEPGAALYEQRCAACHRMAGGRTPPRAVLKEMAPEAIVAAMTEGPMQPQAAGMTKVDMEAVADYLSDKPFGAPKATHPNPCSQPAGALALKEQDWNGWGRDLGNSRYQPKPGIRANEVPRLKLKWAYAHDGRFAHGQPSIAGNRLLIGNTLGEVRALDAKTGCEHWMFKAGTSVKAAITVGQVKVAGRKRNFAFFGDERASAYAVDAESGALIWKSKIDTVDVARIVGAPVFHDGVVYFTMSSAEEGASGDPSYACCKFRGSVSALSALDGKTLWKSYPIPAAPAPYKVSSVGTQLFGPAGAAIWSAATIDTKRKLIYVATGNSYTDVENDGSDAVVAFDLATGARRWANQLTPKDNFVSGCPRTSAGKNNCPITGGPDFDFGSSPILHRLPNGKDIIIAGQKSGIVHALDPEGNGKVIWQTQVGKGSALGGVEWGPAVDKEHAYVAIADAGVREGGQPGLTALNLKTGEKIWQVPTPIIKCSWGEEQCRRGQPGAVSVIPGVVFSGALDGHLRAYDAKTGAVVWDFDTGKLYPTVNGPETSGGAVDQGGATIANGIVYVNSGFGRWGRPGRLLLAFSVDGK